MADVDVLIVREPIELVALEPLARAWHGILVKGVADLRREVLAIGGEWHMDANTVLLADGSRQEDVWGFNVYPEKRGDDAVEYVSLINIRPGQGNRGMHVADPAVRKQMRAIIIRLIPDLFA